MKILGIDPGTATIGFGLIEFKNNRYRLLEAGVITTPSNLNLAQRLSLINDELSEIVKQSKPDVTSVEKLFFAQNVKTAISVAHARGVILLTIDQLGLPVYEYTPLQIKQSVTGYGRADKKQVQAMVSQILNLKKPITQDDCADAVATAICHAMNSSTQALNITSSL